MDYEIGNIYSISLADAIKELEGKTASELQDGDKFYFAYGYVICNVDDFAGQLYLDFYDNEGNLAICDGEEAKLIDADEYAFTFEGIENEPKVPFKLARNAEESAIYDRD